MTSTLAVALPFIVAGVLAASAVAKLRRPDDLTGWAELGVPRALRRRWLLAFHPWGELVLAAALVFLGGALGLVAGIVATALMAAYLVLIVRAHRSTPDASCACFGDRRPVTRVTILRNVWLTVLAAASASVIAVNPLWGGAASAAGGSWMWLFAVAVAATTATLILWPDAPASGAGAGDVRQSAPGADDVRPSTPGDEDYVRVRTPAVPISLGDGTVLTLRDLSAARPVLLLAVSETCHACETVIARAGQWRALLPEVDVRLLLTTPPGASGLTATTEPQTVHDTHGYVRASIKEWGTPTAVLLGADGLLAGGPESGSDRVVEFIDEIRASLDEISGHPAHAQPS